MDKILIIGMQGSGKSTFANKLGKKLNREVIHLDSVYYKSGWQRAYPVRDDWKQKVRDLASKEKWIIDGQYTSSLDIRIPAADVIVFFNFNKLVCLYRIFKRVLTRKQPFDKPEGNLNHVSWKLIMSVIYFPREKTLEKLEPYKNTKKIFIVKNSQEAEELLPML